MTEHTITEPGFYPDFPEAPYHADPCPVPSLSSGVAKAMLRSPAHGYVAHPRLTKQKPLSSNVDRDKGSAFHTLALGSGPPIVVINAPDWKKKKHQNERQAAYARGAAPLLEEHYEHAKAMAQIVRPMLVDWCGKDFEPECVIAWREGQAWCRTMLDAVSRDRLAVLDLKSTAAGAAPDEANKRFFNDDSDIQAAHQERGLDALDPAGVGRRKIRYLYIENEPPFGVTAVDVTEATMHFARRDVDHAITLWKGCTQSDIWPGYPRVPKRAVEPEWRSRQREDREAGIAELIRKLKGAK
ncbi:MAG: PD-(D/E)XK nuclease-like domain-containing protein [Alphaproteobacteria bacterium]|nr:PD-(D/E)XK nuclease-like domain-containing protein [Alphaproteobacteria bacterium]